MGPPSSNGALYHSFLSLSGYKQSLRVHSTTVEKIQSTPEEMISCIGGGCMRWREHLDVHSDWEGIDWVLRIHIKRHLIIENIIGLVKIPIDKLKTLIVLLVY